MTISSLKYKKYGLFEIYNARIGTYLLKPLNTEYDLKIYKDEDNILMVCNTTIKECYYFDIGHYSKELNPFAYLPIKFKDSIYYKMNYASMDDIITLPEEYLELYKLIDEASEHRNFV